MHLYNMSELLMRIKLVPVYEAAFTFLCNSIPSNKNLKEL